MAFMSCVPNNELDEYKCFSNLFNNGGSLKLIKNNKFITIIYASLISHTRINLKFG